MVLQPKNSAVWAVFKSVHMYQTWQKQAASKTVNLSAEYLALEHMFLSDIPFKGDFAVQDVRDKLAGFAAPLAGGPSFEEVRPASAPVRAEWVVYPGVGNATADPVVIYLHGGGYIAGVIDTYRVFLGLLSQEARVRALTVDYRLAPENKITDAVEDVVEVYKWLLASGTPATKIAIMGDSAGGALTLLATQAILKLKLAKPGAVVGLSPWSDLTLTAGSVRRLQMRDIIIKPDFMTAMRDLVLGGRKPDDALISPLFGDFTGFPPLYLSVGDNEVLLDDSASVAEKAKKQGVLVELAVGKGMFHIYPVFRDYVPEANVAAVAISAFVNRHLAAK